MVGRPLKRGNAVRGRQPNKPIPTVQREPLIHTRGEITSSSVIENLSMRVRSMQEELKGLPRDSRRSAFLNEKISTIAAHLPKTVKEELGLK